MDQVEDLLRELAPQVLAILVRRYGDFDGAEDAVQEALVVAHTHWRDGVPEHPFGWLVTTGAAWPSERTIRARSGPVRIVESTSSPLATSSRWSAR